METLLTLDDTFAAIEQLASTLDTTSVNLSRGFLKTNETLQTSLVRVEEFMQGITDMAAWERQELHMTLEELNLAARSMRNLAESLERKPESVSIGSVGR